MIVPIAIFAGVLLLAARAPQDLKSVAAEPNLARRARAALAFGEQSALRAGDACKGNDYEKCDHLLDDVRDAVELADKSLDQTGVDPRRSPGNYKNAEIRTRKILREVDALKSYIHPDDLDHFDTVYRRISEIDDRLLAAIMGQHKKKKK